jgi:hypothetical protein
MPGLGILTIAIPTFNRPDDLRRTVELLLPQLVSDCRLLIIDNHSDVPVSHSLADILASAPPGAVHVMRNACNIGGNANIMRCMEQCQTAWLWMLNDHATPKPNAVAEVLKEIHENRNCFMLHFLCQYGTGTTPAPRRAEGRVDGRTALLKSVDNIMDLVDITRAVYRIPAIVSGIKVGYLHTYSCMPHVVTLLSSMDSQSQVLLSNTVLVTRGEVTNRRGWSMRQFSLGCLTPLYLPIGAEDRRLILEGLLRYLPSVAWFLTSSLLASRAGDTDAKYYFKAYRDTVLVHDRRPMVRLIALAGSLMLKVPATSLAILRLVGRPFGKKIDDAKDDRERF